VSIGPCLEVGGAAFRARRNAEMLAWAEVHGGSEVMDLAGVCPGSRWRGSSPRPSVGQDVNGPARDLTGAGLQAYGAAGIHLGPRS